MRQINILQRQIENARRRRQIIPPKFSDFEPSSVGSVYVISELVSDFSPNVFPSERKYLHMGWISPVRIIEYDGVEIKSRQGMTHSRH
jgi:hypothetical protein